MYQHPNSVDRVMVREGFEPFYIYTPIVLFAICVAATAGVCVLLIAVNKDTSNVFGGTTWHLRAMQLAAVVGFVVHVLSIVLEMRSEAG